ncbi:MAG: leucyl/phenylalanyl-tRNA--protein transferase [Oligoflexus sp.]
MKRLNTDILLVAYTNGFFPMPHPQTEEICWFNPDPRAIIPLDQFHVSRSLRRTLRKGVFTATIDKDFAGVIAGCASREETWINREIREAYTQLHRDGYAHSLEVWHDDQLAGGVYGVALGGAFFAESKFHTVADASKAALYFLVEHLRSNGFQLLEVQFLIPHLARLGAKEISAVEYHERLGKALKVKPDFSDFEQAKPPA